MRVLAILLAVVVLPILVSGEARAHASLVAAEPADGAILDEAPARLVLTFNEPVSPTVLRLVGPDGNPTPLADPEFDGSRLSIAVAHVLGKGTHVLSWRVVSLDGHPVAGSIVFSIGKPSAGATPTAARSSPGLRSTTWAVRVALYAAMFFGVGGIFFVTFLVPGRALPTDRQRLMTAACAWGVVLAPVALGLQGLDLLGLEPNEVLRPDVWRAAIATTYFQTVVLAELAFVAALAAQSVSNAPSGRLLAALAFLAVGCGLASSGHASNAPPTLLSRPAVFIHVTGVAFWLGALFPLATLARTGGTRSTEALRRFSAIIPAVLVPLVATGAYLAVVQVKRPEALLATSYGWILDAKIVVVLCLLALGAYNRFRLTRRVTAGDLSASRSFFHSVGGEMVLALVVLALVAAWRFTPPPRAAVPETVAPIAVHLHGDKAAALVTITPGHTGEVTIDVTPMTPDMGPLAPSEVGLSFVNRDAGIEPIRRNATIDRNGNWRTEMQLPVAGKWTLTVDLLVSDFDKQTLRGEIDLPR